MPSLISTPSEVPKGKNWVLKGLSEWFWLVESGPSTQHIHSPSSSEGMQSLYYIFKYSNVLYSEWMEVLEIKHTFQTSVIESKLSYSQMRVLKPWDLFPGWDCEEAEDDVPKTIPELSQQLLTLIWNCDCFPQYTMYKERNHQHRSSAVQWLRAGDSVSNS